MPILVEFPHATRTAIAVICCLLALSACASKPDDFLMARRSSPESFGYSEWRVDETRYDIKTAWSHDRLKNLELSGNWRYFVPENEDGDSEAA